MIIQDYITQSGKNVIKEYLGSLPINEMQEGYKIRHEIILNGIEALKKLNTQQLKGELWEIKFSDNRIMYVLMGQKTIYFFHVCKRR